MNTERENSNVCQQHSSKLFTETNLLEKAFELFLEISEEKIPSLIRRLHETFI